MANIFDAIDPDAFHAYACWAAILVIKMVLMSALTTLKRIGRKVFINPEDAALAGAEVVQSDPEVERVRRAHQNDVENIPLFLAVGFLYLLTSPNVTLAVNLFRLVGIARIIHTLVYAVFVIRQPARLIAFFLALVPTIYMALMTIITFLRF
uniref:Microsomal glutathione S-transferase 1 n=2 Tax=Culex tarsalis TaxID=7177 RepID=A0A1Q3F4B4_CULTA